MSEPKTYIVHDIGEKCPHCVVAPEPRKAREWWIDSNASNGPWAAWTYRPCYPKDSLNDRCLVHVREVIE